MHRTHYYDQAKKQIVLKRTLELIQLNETADLIYRDFMAGDPDEKIAGKLAGLYDLPAEEALADVKAATADFREKGIAPDTAIARAGFSPHTVIVHVNQNCNSRCVFCDCWKTGEHRHSLAELKPLFDEALRRGAETFMLSGGEPLLHPEIGGIAAYLKRGGARVMLNSNGLLLGVKADLVGGAGIDELVISMDCVDPGAYKKYRGVDAYGLVWENIKKFKLKFPGIRVGIRATISENTYSSLDRLAAIARENLADNIGFSPLDISSTSFARYEMDPGYSRKLLDSVVPSEKAIDDLLARLVKGEKYYDYLDLEHSRGYFMWGGEGLKRCLTFYKQLFYQGRKDLFGPEPCDFVRVSMLVDYNGELRNCFYSKPFGSIYAVGNSDWSFGGAMDDLARSGACAACRGKLFCGVESL